MVRRGDAGKYQEEMGRWGDVGTRGNIKRRWVDAGIYQEEWAEKFGILDQVCLITIITYG
ncbi:hypothetical protein [Calothrix sp. UHCC 0171]|uniref:hypothetical protein n=1 Tax=Calothrix sp. UHCC 0171 TaxID=3110245 RepID=UPI002B1FE162|nr:hypothetical protein [Calothrix sp. UHCC 0171]MEA5572576.1 hypothetical protein [Calothrix sp. UHCC 0171]